jgi:hypothetical protein
MKKILLPCLLLAMVMTSGGCLGRMIGEAWGGIEQGAGRFDPVNDVTISLDNYTDFEIGEFKDDTAGSVPPEFWTYLPTVFEVLAADQGLRDDPSGPTAVINGTVIYYETADLMSQAFGPYEEVVARVEIVDKATGRVLGTATAVGRTKSTTSQGPETKAKGLSKGIIMWINSHYSEALRKEEIERREAMEDAAN